MNTSSTSSFLNYIDNTTSSGNIYSVNREGWMYFFENGNLIIPKIDTVNAIFESEKFTRGRIDIAEELLNVLNE